MFGLGIQEIVVIVVLILILFDYKKIPEVSRGIGKLYRDIISAQQNIKNEILKSDIEKDLAGEDSKVNGSKSDSSELEKIKKDYNGSGRAG